MPEMTWARRPGGAECGVAGLWVLWACVLLWATTTAALMLGAALVARHRAAAAADLAALAAAQHLLAGDSAPCAAALRVAAAQHTILRSCRLADTTVEVVVETPISGGVTALPPARARARAGGSAPAYGAASAGQP